MVTPTHTLVDSVHWKTMHRRLKMQNHMHLWSPSIGITTLLLLSKANNCHLALYAAHLVELYHQLC